MDKDKSKGGIWQIPQAKWRLGIPLGGLIALVLGALLWIAFDTTMYVTSSNEFCTVCHNSPSQWVAQEWQQSDHYKTSAGVEVYCKDCHIPKEFLPKIWVKSTSALHHTFVQITGDYTEDKATFEAERLRLAEKVWEKFRADDSKACRNCHNVERMDFSEQSELAAQSHQVLLEGEGHVTCIDCHAGIAHHLPKTAKE